MVFMRRSKWGIALLLLVALGLVFWLYPNLNYFNNPPYQAERSLSYLSKATTGPDGSMIAISDSRQEIIRMSSDGIISERIVQKAEENARHDFTDLAVAADGTIYAVDTVLDSYGLYVQEERILRYIPGDSQGELLHTMQGSGTNKRVGHIKGLQVTGDGVYFFVYQAPEVELHQLPLNGSALTEVLRFQLPEDRYMSEIVGYKEGQIYYTSKRGAIFRVSAAGESELAYPLDSMDRTRRNFPEGLLLSENGRLYFIDRLVNSVTSMKAADSSGITTEVNEKELQAAAPGAELLDIMDLAVGADGRIEVVLDDRIIGFNPDGTTTELSKASYNRGYVLQGWVTWTAAAILVIVIIALLRLFYTNILNRRISLFFKQVFVLVPILSVAMLLLSNFMYDSFSARMEEDMKLQLAMLARNGQNLIDGEKLKRLTSPSDYMNEDYQEIQKRMNSLFESADPANRKGLYSTLYKFENGEIFIMMDDDDGVNMFKPFVMSPGDIAIREQGIVSTGRWEDATGRWLYGIGPVFDDSGKVVGVYETGRDLNVLEQANQTIYNSIVKNILWVSLLLIAVLLTLTYMLLSSVRKLRKSVMEMANGNWDATFQVRTQDEVGDLGEQFNRMAHHIRTYIKDITSFSEASHRFVPQQFFKYLGKKGILDIHLGDQVQQNMAVMVANIRSFNKLSKQLTPKQNFDFMNAFLKRFSPFVRKEDGLISKYLGAGFMALFPSHSDDALRAAVNIRRDLAAFNDTLAASGIPPVDMGMAIHKGPLILGIVGEEQRMEGNVISDDVNLTTTLERMSDAMGASVLVTKTFFDQLRSPERFRHRSLGRVHIDGKDEPLELIDVYEGESEQTRGLKDLTKEQFERGIELCQEGRFYDARETFIEVIRINRMDKAAKLYFYLCDEYYQKGASEGWNGTLAV